ncbi:hypothetical protein SCHPADRAFT_558832 [Schizopora paradoxa]|uniref:F-box domain-containing protein n=1 Tax=Schizopora paradoxa TaxID=27342 RepID=A0A0H2RXY0_9AGAM|nr:hypothetical protein SCHPADRAFT_558832 [Schizopora paradoxa]
MSSTTIAHQTRNGATETFEEMKIRLMEDINSLVSNSFEPCFRLPQQLEEEEHFLDCVTYGNLLAQGVNRDDGGRGFSLVSRARYLTSRMEYLNGVLLKISAGFSWRINTGHQRIQRLGAVCGLAALPPEILANIFSFVVYGFPSDELRSCISVQLSHVCRHFRDVVISNPHFWTEIQTTPRKPEIGLVEACVQRSKNCPLDIDLNLYTSAVDVALEPGAALPDGIPVMEQRVECDGVLPILIPHIHRWRSLHLEYNKADGFSGSTELFESIQGSLFPMLQLIEEFQNHAGGENFDRSMAYASTWNTPLLTTLILADCLPRSLLSVTSITKFHVLLFSLNDAVKMLDLLGGMQSVSNLLINVSYFYFFVDGEEMEANLVAHKVVVLENVKDFEFCFGSMHAANADRYFLRTFLSKLHVPNAINVFMKGLKTKVRDNSVRRSEGRLRLHQLLSGIAAGSPKIANLDISVERNPTRLNTVLPRHFPPGLEDLKFTCNSNLQFFQKELDAQDGVPELGKLRTLTLGVNSECDTSAVKRWVPWLVSRLKLCGGWGSFEELVLFEYDVDLEDYVFEETIPRDDILGWCKCYDGAPLKDGYESYRSDV